MKRWIAIWVLAALGAPVLCLGQTTQGLISGRVVDSENGNPIANARVSCLSLATNTREAARADASGYYVVPLLPPGVYRLRVAADQYQAQELAELELTVAAFLEINFRLRPIGDVWEQGEYRSVFLPGTGSVLTFYGPDVDTTHSALLPSSLGNRGGLESTVSQVIDPAQVRDLPLAGRDVYTTLAVQPGVTSDTTTARGLGLSANGQRPSSSNFLLDGLENNNYLVTGPLTIVAPEAVQEYRISTNNFSAEYGRTSGYVANAVTRAGGSQWHGLGYYYMKNEVLNANDFQRNLQGLSRSPVKESQPGFSVGGPLRANRLFASGSFEYLRSRGFGEPQEFTLPTPAFVEFTDPSSLARSLLQKYPPPGVAASGNPFLGTATISPPVFVDQYLALPRVDYLWSGGADRLMGRVAVAKVRQPDFIWTPYRDFVSPLDQNTVGLAIALTNTLRPNLIHEARLGWSRDNLEWPRAHPEIPTLASADGAVLPGSPAYYAYRNHSRSWELVDNLLWTRGRHIVKAGGGFVLRQLDGFLTAGQDPLFLFDTVIDFALAEPRLFGVSVSRQELPKLMTPQYDREYRYNQFSAFVQDSFKATPRLVLNFGVRYENFGAPRNVGAAKDAAVVLGGGATLAQRLASAQLTFPGGGDQQLYDSDNNDWGVRLGFSYNLRGNGRTVLRGAYGTFYDRPFDNLWQNLRANSFATAFLDAPAGPVNYLAPISSLLAGYPNTRLSKDFSFPQLTMYQPGLQNAYVQSYFLGVQHPLTDTLTLEVNALGSLGRKLITTDQVNRPFSIPNSVANPNGRFNPDLPQISYRSNQGSSDYNALTVVARRRARHSQFQVAYTWSHSIDNQSEPLAGDFFDLSYTRITAAQGLNGIASFARQFDSGADRGNSDFDQRHNLVFLSIWDVPALFSSSRAARVFRDWQFSQLAAIRSGFPYSVNVPSGTSLVNGYVVNNRADVIDPAHALVSAAAAGGKTLLNPDAFRQPAPGALGNSGRNAFVGPGLFSIDLSLGRSFRLPWLGEAGRAVFRADAFNFLNHANLNNPDSLLTSDTFGLALYGRKGRSTGFPAVAPFNETARQVQLLFRVEF